MKIFFLIVVLQLINIICYSQKLGTWNVLDLRKKINDKVILQFEGQVRSLEFYNKFHYHELNFTVNVKQRDNLVFSGLLGKHNTYTEGGDFKSPIVTDEIRLSLQASTSQKFNKFILDNRYRIEERYFFNTKQFATRARVKIALSYNIISSLKWQVSNEFFLALGNTNSTFEKNRFAIGFAKSYLKRYETQINYLNQKDNRISDESGSRFFQIIQVIFF
jgi:hypothetical protein